MSPLFQGVKAPVSGNTESDEELARAGIGKITPSQATSAINALNGMKPRTMKTYTEEDMQSRYSTMTEDEMSSIAAAAWSQRTNYATAYAVNLFKSKIASFKT